MLDNGQVRPRSSCGGRVLVGMAVLALLGACASSGNPRSGNDEPSRAAQGAETAVFGVAMIAVIPVAVVAVSFEALAYPEKFHRSPVVRQPLLTGPVSLDAAYVAAYGTHVNSQDVDQSTGQVLRTHMTHVRSMLEAQISFVQLAERYGLHHVRYQLCREAQSSGGHDYLLLSLVYRKIPKFSTQLHKVDPLVPAISTDSVIDWVALDAAILEQDKTYALLLAGAVDETLHTPPTRPDPAAEYWAVAQHWRSGDVAFVLDLSEQRARRILAGAPPRPPH